MTDLIYPKSASNRIVFFSSSPGEGKGRAQLWKLASIWQTTDAKRGAIRDLPNDPAIYHLTDRIPNNSGGHCASLHLFDLSRHRPQSQAGIRGQRESESCKEASCKAAANKLRKTA